MTDQFYPCYQTRAEQKATPSSDPVTLVSLLLSRLGRNAARVETALLSKPAPPNFLRIGFLLFINSFTLKRIFSGCKIHKTCRCRIVRQLVRSKKQPDSAKFVVWNRRAKCRNKVQLVRSATRYITVGPFFLQDFWSFDCFGGISGADRILSTSAVNKTFTLIYYQLPAQFVFLRTRTPSRGKILVRHKCRAQLYAARSFCTRARNLSLFSLKTLY